MINKKVLIQKAFEAREMSYSPYSKFKVGAALLGKNGKIYLGCNIENASYSPTNCAERTAFFKAVSEGQMDFKAIAIVGASETKQNEEGKFCAPCGVCRQVMAEFCDGKSFLIILAKSETEYKEFVLEDLLPLSFTKENTK